MTTTQATQAPAGGSAAAAAAPARRTGLWSVRAAGFAGLLFSALLIIVLVLLRDSPPATDAGSLAWLNDERDRIEVALYLIPFAGIAFLWFLAAVRRRIGRAEDQFFSTVFLATGLLFTAMLFAAGAAADSAAVLGRGDAPAANPAIAVVARSLAQTLFYVFAIKMAAAFMLITSSIGMRSGALPRWFALIGMVSALLMLLSVGAFEPVAVVFPIWTAAVSILLLRLPAAAWDQV